MKIDNEIFGSKLETFKFVDNIRKVDIVNIETLINSEGEHTYSVWFYNHEKYDLLDIKKLLEEMFKGFNVCIECCAETPDEFKGDVPHIYIETRNRIRCRAEHTDLNIKFKTLNDLNLACSEIFDLLLHKD